MRDEEFFPDGVIWLVGVTGYPLRNPEREDSRTAKVDELCDRLECQMMGIRYE